MAIASSSPELFINSVGTFITEGDLGIGAIVGSAVFNILAVPACCGFFANMVNKHFFLQKQPLNLVFGFQVIQLEWWPLTRDSLMYSVSVVMLIGVLMDGKVQLWEALMLVGAYVFYILGKIEKTQIITLLNTWTFRLTLEWGFVTPMFILLFPKFEFCIYSLHNRSHGKLLMSKLNSSPTLIDRMYHPIINSRIGNFPNMKIGRYLVPLETPN